MMARTQQALHTSCAHVLKGRIRGLLDEVLEYDWGDWTALIPLALHRSLLGKAPCLNHTKAGTLGLGVPCANYQSPEELA